MAEKFADKFERHRQPWKPEELQKLRILAAKGKGLKEIAKALNRSCSRRRAPAREAAGATEP